LRDDIPVMVLDGTTGSFALRVPHSVGNVSSRILVDVEVAGSEEIRFAHGGGCELAVKALETVNGDTALALALAKAPAVQSLVTALQTFAGAIGTATTIAQVAAAGTALQGLLAALPPIPTTKLRSE
jgi:hypothetical protein